MNFNNEEMKYFSAITYDDNIYTFAVTPEGYIYCEDFDIVEPTSILELKPNFVLRNEEGCTFYSLDDYTRERKVKKSLISGWIIDDDLFEYLINNRRIMYSTQMAVLYGFEPKYAFDAHSQSRAFKSSRNNPKKRAKILESQKQGKFN